MFGGRDDGLAPISANVSHLDDRASIFCEITDNVSSYVGEDLRWQPIDGLRKVPGRWNEPQHTSRTSDLSSMFARINQELGEMDDKGLLASDGSGRPTGNAQGRSVSCNLVCSKPGLSFSARVGFAMGRL